MGLTSKGREGRGRKSGQEGEGRDQEKGKGVEGERGRRGREGDRDGRESLKGQGREGEGVGKRGGEGKFRGQPPSNVCFLEPRLVKTPVSIITHPKHWYISYSKSNNRLSSVYMTQI